MLKKSITAALAGAGLTALVATSALAASLVYDEHPFTTAEVANWTVDRTVPSGGYESVSFGGRDDVLEIRIDSDNRSTGSAFFYTEGLKRDTTGAAALTADLYVDPSWQGQDIRAGLWGVGTDASGDIVSYPIAEYHQDVADGEAGWRMWPSSAAGGWVDHPGTTGYGEWAQLEIVLDADNDQFILSVDGVAATVPANGSTSLDDTIVNSYNYGTGTPDYDVHWSDFAIGSLVDAPTSKDDCKKGGWADFDYRNQGQCIADFNRSLRG